MNGVYGLKVVTPPSGEPVSTAEVQSHLRIPATDIDNGEVSRLITAAREYVETVTARQCLTAQYTMSLEAFPGRRIDEARPPGWRYGVIHIPRSPLVSVDAVNYYPFTTPSVLTLLDPSQYMWSNFREYGRLAPAPFLVWPISNPYQFDAVQITFTAGFGTADLVPERIKQCIRWLVGHLYEHREASVEAALQMIPVGLKDFIWASRVMEYV